MESKQLDYYRKLEQENRLIELPCEVFSVVYVIKEDICYKYWISHYMVQEDRVLAKFLLCNDQFGNYSYYMDISYFERNNVLFSMEEVEEAFRDAAFMGIMRWSFYNKLKEEYPEVYNTYGYITKNTRIKNNLEKSHCVDARCISGNPTAKPLGYYYEQRFLRKNNRSLHKANPKKGKRKSNQAPRYVCGYQLFDKVVYKHKECFIFGRRSSGYFDLRLLDGTSIHKSANVKEISKIKSRNTLIIERRMQDSAFASSPP